MSQFKKKVVINSLRDDIKEDPNSFYQNDFVNFRGKTADTNESYQAIVATYLTKHATYELLDEISLNEAEFNHEFTSSHECSIVKKMIGNSYDFIGKIVDYNVRDDLKPNKVDLFTTNDVELYCLEIKNPHHKESLLKCALSVYTLFKETDVEMLIEKHHLSEDLVFSPGLVLYPGSVAYKEYQQGPKEVLNLINLLGIEVYLLTRPEETYQIELPII